MRRPCGATFGFGGQLAGFGVRVAVPGVEGEAAAEKPNGTAVSVFRVTTAEEGGVAGVRGAVASGGSDALKGFCGDKRGQSAAKEEAETWGFLGILFEDDAGENSSSISSLATRSSPRRRRDRSHRSRRRRRRAKDAAEAEAAAAAAAAAAEPAPLPPVDGESSSTTSREPAAPPAPPPPRPWTTAWTFSTRWTRTAGSPNPSAPPAPPPPAPISEAPGDCAR